MTKEVKEDYLQKGMWLALVGLLGWNIWTTQQLTISVAVLNEKIDKIEEELSKI